MALTQYLNKPVVGFHGMIETGFLGNRVSSYKFDEPATKQVDTITVSAASNDKTYSIEIDGVTASYTSDATATQPEIAQGLKDAINADGLLNSKVIASYDAGSANDCVITARLAGIGFETVESDAELSLANTVANDQADNIEVGRLVIRDGAKVQIIASSALTARVVELAPTAADSSIYSVTVMINENPFQATFTADASATATEICDGIRAAFGNIGLPSGYVSFGGTATLTMTASVAGQWFDFGYGADGLNSAGWSVSADNNGVMTDLNDAALGVVVFSQIATIPDGQDFPVYSGPGSVDVLEVGTIYVRTEDDIGLGQDVYVGVAGAEAGKWRGSSAANYVKLNKQRFRFIKNINSRMAVLECKA